MLHDGVLSPNHAIEQLEELASLLQVSSGDQLSMHLLCNLYTHDHDGSMISDIRLLQFVPYLQLVHSW